MNPPEQKISPTTRLFGGEELPITFLNGENLAVRVRALPARNLGGYLALRDVGKEAELLAIVVQQPRPAAEVNEFPGWAPVDAAFVDNLSDVSHVELLAIADKLNLSRAIEQAERQIATGTALLPLSKRIVEAQMKPMKDAIDSMTKSLTTALSSAVAVKQL